MSPSLRSARLRWAVPVAVAGLIGAGAVALPLVAGAASPSLPEKSPAEVLALALSPDVPALSGSIDVTTNLGVPQIVTSMLGGATTPAEAEGESGGSSDSDLFIRLLTSDSSLRVWADGPDRQRLQILDPLSETDVVRNGDTAWVYSSVRNGATQYQLSDRDTADTTWALPSPDSLPTPQELADRALAEAAGDTDISVDGTARVAGRAAYELVLAPTAPETLVAAVRVAVDAETGMALSFTVEQRADDEPAFSVAFTSLDLRTPDADVFDFVPPADATVEEGTLPNVEVPSAEAFAEAKDDLEDNPSTGADVVGNGWSTIAVIPGGTAVPEMLQLLLTPVDGGAVLETALVTLLRTDDGRWLIGSVTTEALLDAAAATE